MRREAPSLMYYLLEDLSLLDDYENPKEVVKQLLEEVRWERGLA